MISISRGSRQPRREPWSLDRLTHERSIALGLSIDNSSHLTYTSALNSYLTFCKTHDFPIEPTQQTLSFFVVYMSAHIKPDSVNSYLSGICNQLEVYFPDIRKNRNSILVSRTLAGCRRRFGTTIRRKRPLSTDDLITVLSQLQSAPHHDEKLFLAILFTGFHGLFRLGELTFPDRVASRDYRKIMLRHTVDITQTTYSLLLPGHKADRFFEGNIVIIQKTNLPTNPHNIFTTYISSRDTLHPFKPELWLRTSGTVPTRSWFIRKLRRFFPSDIAGQSMRAGGATSLAEAGVPPHIIQATGRWASNTFHIYIRKNPILLHAMLFGRPAHQQATGH